MTVTTPTSTFSQITTTTTANLAKKQEISSSYTGGNIFNPSHKLFAVGIIVIISIGMFHLSHK
jgi:hypothetical protein